MLIWMWLALGLQLMDEVENEDLVFTLETIVEKFGEEIAPFAVGLTQNLVRGFWKSVALSNEEVGCALT